MQAISKVGSTRLLEKPEFPVIILVNGVEALHRGGVEPMASFLHIWSREKMLPNLPDDVTQPTGC